MASDCTYGRAASCETPCSGPTDLVLVYRSRSGRVIDRSPVCLGHAEEARSRAWMAGSMATVTIEPADAEKGAQR